MQVAGTGADEWISRIYLRNYHNRGSGPSGIDNRANAASPGIMPQGRGNGKKGNFLVGGKMPLWSNRGRPGAAFRPFRPDWAETTSAPTFVSSHWKLTRPSRPPVLSIAMVDLLVFELRAAQIDYGNARVVPGDPINAGLLGACSHLQLQCAFEDPRAPFIPTQKVPAGAEMVRARIGRADPTVGSIFDHQTGNLPRRPQLVVPNSNGTPDTLFYCQTSTSPTCENPRGFDPRPLFPDWSTARRQILKVGQSCRPWVAQH